MTGMKTQNLYSVVTLAECMQNPATLDWLVHADVPVPAAFPPGRYPTPAEIRSVLENIPGIRLTYRVSPSVWEVTLTSRKDVTWAILAVQDFNGDEDAACRFYFTGGWDELILLAAGRLVKTCGPLVLLHDSGAAPQVVL
jgi:hypothetical protein